MHDDDTDIHKRFKALSNPNRLAIFRFLRSQGAAVAVEGAPPGAADVSTIAGQFDLALSTVSHHLRTLHEAGLIRCEPRGQRMFCVIDDEAVAELRAFLDVEEE